MYVYMYVYVHQFEEGKGGRESEWEKGGLRENEGRE